MEALKTKEEAAKAVQTYAHLIASMAITVAERDKAQAQLDKEQIALTKLHQPKINALAEQANGRRTIGRNSLARSSPSSCLTGF